MTNQSDATADDELWTVGQAAAYLNAGGVDLRFRPRRVTEMISRGELPGLQTHVQGWRRTPASAIRRLRAELLRELGRVDPAFPLAANQPQDDAGAAPEDGQGSDQEPPAAG